VSEYKDPQQALAYLDRADSIPHRAEGEAALLDEVPEGARRILDLGTGDGRLLAMLLKRCPQAEGVALDYSPTMLERARKRFKETSRVRIVEHDLALPLPDLGRFDVAASSFAIHHLTHERKRELYLEIRGALLPGGIFCNLEHVASPTPRLHERFLAAIGTKPEEEDRSNKLLDVETQLRWLRDLGFVEVDCLWKWRELALLAGVKAR
jgi:ubiquinone/menaquinone biosynthesis C-methylase UbiE